MTKKEYIGTLEWFLRVYKSNGADALESLLEHEIEREKRKPLVSYGKRGVDRK